MIWNLFSTEQMSVAGIHHLQESTADGSDLNHGRDIGLDVGLLDLGVGAIVDVALKVLRVEGAGDETLVNTPSGTHQTERQNGEP